MANYGVPSSYVPTVAESQTLYFDPAEEDDYETDDGKNFVVVQTMVSFIEKCTWLNGDTLIGGGDFIISNGCISGYVMIRINGIIEMRR